MSKQQKVEVVDLAGRRAKALKGFVRFERDPKKSVPLRILTLSPREQLMSCSRKNGYAQEILPLRLNDWLREQKGTAELLGQLPVKTVSYMNYAGAGSWSHGVSDIARLEDMPLQRLALPVPDHRTWGHVIDNGWTELLPWLAQFQKDIAKGPGRHFHAAWVEIPSIWQHWAWRRGEAFSEIALRCLDGHPITTDLIRHREDYPDTAFDVIQQVMQNFADGKLFVRRALDNKTEQKILDPVYNQLRQELEDSKNNLYQRETITKRWIMRGTNCLEIMKKWAQGDYKIPKQDSCCWLLGRTSKEELDNSGLLEHPEVARYHTLLTYINEEVTNPVLQKIYEAPTRFDQVLPLIRLFFARYRDKWRGRLFFSRDMTIEANEQEATYREDLLQSRVHWDGKQYVSHPLEKKEANEAARLDEIDFFPMVNIVGFDFYGCAGDLEYWQREAFEEDAQEAKQNTPKGVKDIAPLLFEIHPEMKLRNMIQMLNPDVFESYIRNRGLKETQDAPDYTQQNKGRPLLSKNTIESVLPFLGHAKHRKFLTS